MRSVLAVLAAAVVLAGCAGPATPSPTPSVIASASTPTTPVPQPGDPTDLSTPSIAPTPGVTTITIELVDGGVFPNGDRVELDKGQPFVLDITSDRDDEVHVHGFDEEIEVKAGDHLRVDLTADRTGRFEVESHHPELLIVVLQIR